MRRWGPRLVGVAFAIAAATTSAAEIPAGAPGDWLARAQRDIATREYRATHTDAGLQAPNRAHDLRTYFAPDGIRVHDRTDPEVALVSMTLAGVGRGAKLAPIGAGEVVSDGERVEIRRPGLVEWYVNDASGIEQGFTLSKRPAGEGALVLELAVGEAQVKALGDSVLLETPTKRSLAYSKLAVADARGVPIEARMEVPSRDRVRLVVEDASAHYPLVIDPLLTALFDTSLLSDQAGSYFGYSVAGAGDVNGDGYGDVIVGAYEYDAGEANEGAAFVFLGAPGGIASVDSAQAAAQLESNQADAGFGVSVDGAGDVNGDGYADVIVGAYGYDPGAVPSSGGAFVFLGGPAGIADGDPSTAATVLVSDQAGSYVGYDVSGAGDVNGDGFGDVVVSATSYPGGAAPGSAFVFHGSAAGISSGPMALAATQLDSDQVGSGFGFSVAGAGDVNGDGFGDVIVSARDYDLGELDEGAAFVFHGSLSGVADATPGTAASVLQGNDAGAVFGFSVAGAGDVNGDGYADVVVGALYYGALDPGAGFLFLGSPTGIASGAPGDPNCITLSGVEAGENAGTGVASAGDVNGDGYGDVVVGAYIGVGASGTLRVYLGEAGWTSGGFSATPYRTISSAEVSSHLGYSVDGAGDVDGDGFDDLIVGAPAWGAANEGAAFVWRGGNPGIVDGSAATANSHLGAPSAPYSQYRAFFGASTAAAGDVNADGYGDVIVGAPEYDAGQSDEGAAFVFLGGPAGVGHSFTARFESDQADAFLGWSVGGAGDVNGDGYDDVIVGAPAFGGAAYGAAYVFLGGPSGPASGAPSSAAALFESNEIASLFGVSVAGAGDVNGDGYADTIVGARSYSLGEVSEGAAFVFLGSPTGPGNRSPNTADATFQSNATASLFGASVAGAGDVNGDGYADVIVGAPQYGGSGAVFIFPGDATGIGSGNPATAASHLSSDQALAELGASVAGAGDVNGDGYGDVIVGAILYDSGHSDEGAAFIFLGGAAGVASGSSATAAARLESDQPNANLGFSVDGAGDVNGDGYADVIVGAPLYDAFYPDEGAAFVFPGSATGIANGNPATTTAQLESDFGAGISAFGGIGRSVAGAGDVNGDGFGDVITGHLIYGLGGSAFVFLGNGNRLGKPVFARQLRASGASAVPAWGSAHGIDSFRVSMRAIHPQTRGRVKLEVESCPPGVAFGAPSCDTTVDPAWTDVTTAAGVTLETTIAGLNDGDLVRWRARVLYAPPAHPGVATPPNPPHGPWRRVQAQVNEGDVRIHAPVCSNALDDDGDGFADYPADPGCASAADESERSSLLVCDDGLDADGDGAIDVPGDPGCDDPSDVSEQSELLVCDDGLDNDGDAAIDFPADPGCDGLVDDSEQSLLLVCDDGIDNDGDLAIDFPADADCESLTGASESPVVPPATLAVGAVQNDSSCALDVSGANNFVNYPFGSGPCGPLGTNRSRFDMLASSSALSDSSIRLRVQAAAAADIDASGYEYLATGLNATFTLTVNVPAGQDWTVDLASVARGALVTVDDANPGNALATLEGAIAPFNVTVGPNGYSFTAAGWGTAISTGQGGAQSCIPFEAARNDAAVISGTGPGTFPVQMSSSLRTFSNGNEAAILFGIDDVMSGLYGDTTADNYAPNPVAGCGGRVAAEDGYDVTVTIRLPACSDGVDNDEDGLLDVLDPDCNDANDRSETPDCGDGVDNDGDGGADFPLDLQCLDTQQRDETGPAFPLPLPEGNVVVAELPSVPSLGTWWYLSHFDPLDPVESRRGLARGERIEDFAIGANGKVAYASDYNAVLLDVATGLKTPLTSPPNYFCAPFGIAAIPGGFVVADFYSSGTPGVCGFDYETGEAGKVILVDGLTGQQSLPVINSASDPLAMFGYPADVTATSDGSTLYVVDAYRLLRMERLADGTWLRSVVRTFSPADPSWVRVAVDETGALRGSPDGAGLVYLASQSSSVLVVDPAQGPETDSQIIPGGAAYDIEIVPTLAGVGPAGPGSADLLLPGGYGAAPVVLRWNGSDWMSVVGPQQSGFTFSVAVARVPYACGNHVDDDGDGTLDFGPNALNDPGCSSAGDTSERSAAFVCDDGLDNDADFDVDFPFDAGCASPTSPAENPACDDGLDNDADGLTDFPNDPACQTAASTKENPKCDDGLDNDGDGKIDWDGGPSAGAPDPGCVAKPWKDKESPGCGLGAELTLILPLLAWAQRRRAAG